MLDELLKVLNVLVAPRVDLAFFQCFCFCAMKKIKIKMSSVRATFLSAFVFVTKLKAKVETVENAQ